MKRRDPPVHLGPLAAQPHVGVDQEGEVNRRRPLGQLLHVAFRGEHEDLVLVEVHLEELEEFLGGVGVLLELEELAEPGEVPVNLALLPPLALVQPVGRDAVLGGPVHVLGPDLDLIEVPPGPEDRGVERLVGVGFGARDVVLDALLERGPAVVDDAEHVIALRHRAHDHPHRHEIVDLLERLVALAHLLVDGPEMLGPAGHLEPGESSLAEFVLEGPAELLDQLLALGAPGRHRADQRLVVVGLEILEGQVLEFGLDPGHAEAVGQRRIDLPGLGGDADPLLRRQRIQGAHVVQPVGQFDDDDPGVLGDREQEFPVVFDLLFRGGAEGEVGDLGEPVHDPGHLRTELLGDLLGADVGVFHHGVQQGGHHRYGVELLLDQGLGDRDAVGDEILPRDPLLAPVRGGAEPERAVNLLQIEPVLGPFEQGSEIRGNIGQRAGHGDSGKHWQ